MKDIIKDSLRTALDRVDSLFSRGYLKLFKEKSSLITFLFHGLFRDQQEMAQNLVDPQQGLTVKQFEEFVDYYVHAGYEFIGPGKIISGLNPGKRYILVTFDDGYFNNYYALDTMRKYNVPAVFFISINQIKQNKCFWWDVLYRERKKRQVAAWRIMQEQNVLKSKTASEIEAYLTADFGENAFCPISDIDRPFTVKEFRAFALDPRVYIGNHTLDHAILTNYDAEGINEQIGGCQDVLEEWTGERPSIISYPNGNYSQEVIKVSRRLGLKLGISVEPRKNYLPIDFQGNSICLGRFVLMGNRQISEQCEIFRSDIVLHNNLKNLAARVFKHKEQ